MRFTNIREYTTIAGHVYRTSVSNYMGITFLPGNVSIKKTTESTDGWRIMTDVDDWVDDINSFFAALYIHFSSGVADAAVIAMRGTDDKKIGNLITDVVSWWSAAMGDGKHDRRPGYVANALVFVKSALDYIDQHFPELSRQQITVTGHSLGGALAQIAGAQGFRLPVFSFNSSSCRGLLGPSESKIWRHITNVNSRYGILNKVGGPAVGKLNDIDVPEMEAEAKSLFANFSESEFKNAQTLVASSESIDGLQPNDPAVDLLGRIEHFHTLLGATVGLDKLPREHMKLIECQDQKEYYMLSNILYQMGRDVGCDLKVKFSSAEATIKAQHSIVNLIKAIAHMPEVAGQAA